MIEGALKVFLLLMLFIFVVNGLVLAAYLWFHRHPKDRNEDGWYACTHCQGKGYYNFGGKEWYECGYCHGKGWV